MEAPPGGPPRCRQRCRRDLSRAEAVPGTTAGGLVPLRHARGCSSDVRVDATTGNDLRCARAANSYLILLTLALPLPANARLLLVMSQLTPSHRYSSDSDAFFHLFIRAKLRGGNGPVYGFGGLGATVGVGTGRGRLGPHRQRWAQLARACSACACVYVSSASAWAVHPSLTPHLMRSMLAALSLLATIMSCHSECCICVSVPHICGNEKEPASEQRLGRCSGGPKLRGKPSF